MFIVCATNKTYMPKFTFDIQILAVGDTPAKNLLTCTFFADSDGQADELKKKIFNVYSTKPPVHIPLLPFETTNLKQLE